jgi:hypothetical protein
MQKPFGFRASGCSGLLLMALGASAVSCSQGQNSSPAQSPDNATTEAPSATSAGGSAPAPAGAGGASVFVVHLVSDFEAFRKYFEDGSALRDQSGVKGYLLSRMDDGRVIAHFFADDVEKVKAALDSPELEKYLNRKGAPDASLVWVTRNEVTAVPATAPAAPTYSLLYKLHVTDFPRFRRAFEERTSFFTAEGVLAYGLHRSVAKDEIVILHFMGNSREKLEALPSLPKFAELLALAAREGAEKPLIASDVARSRPD